MTLESSACLPDYHLDDLTEMANYYNWIMALFTPYLGKHVLEIGAGTGTFSKLLASHPAVASLVLVEPDSRLNCELTREVAEDGRIMVVPAAMEELTPDMLASWRVDTIVMVNVLEHLEDDATVLKTLKDALPPGGKVLTFSPAFPLLFSKFDASAGHVRRYTKHTLYSTFQNAGLTVLEMRYFNLPGFFAWLILMRFLRSTRFGKGRLSLMNQAIPFIQWVERHCSPPLGQSIVAIAEKRRLD